MIILPAIDIKDGQCVRLYQGDYAQVTTYAADPVHVAQRWQAAGASWLHVVDLDGAARGQPVNVELIKHMREATALHIEVGGGMRSLDHIEQMLAAGIDRIILGTVALTDRKLLEEALKRWSERIAVGLDARDGWVATSGWRETSRTKATTLAAELCTLGVQRFIYTDIVRDGALSGPNFEALKEMQRVGRQHRYICAESYRNEREKANLLYWQLTCESFYTPAEWSWFVLHAGRRLLLNPPHAPGRRTTAAHWRSGP